MDFVRLKGGSEKIKNVLQGTDYNYQSARRAAGLGRWTTPPTNYMGTTIFLSYIVAALLLTGYILIGDIFPRVKVRNQDSTPRFWFLITMALISFSVLSANMIAFLWESFSAYLATSDQETATSKIWPWMLTSNLFTTFARNLLADDHVLAWTRQALVMTMVLGAAMSSMGNLHTCV